MNVDHPIVDKSEATDSVIVTSTVLKLGMIGLIITALFKPLTALVLVVVAALFVIPLFVVFLIVRFVAPLGLLAASGKPFHLA